jgi:hypothetical protein
VAEDMKGLPGRSVSGSRSSRPVRSPHRDSIGIHDHVHRPAAEAEPRVRIQQRVRPRGSWSCRWPCFPVYGLAAGAGMRTRVGLRWTSIARDASIRCGNTTQAIHVTTA